MTEYTPARLTGLVLLSAGSLGLEIALTRLLSTIYYPPYVFAVLSLAILGIGLGAAAVSWRTRWRAERYVPAYIACAGLGALVLGIFTVMTASYPWQQIPLFALVVLPYVFVGMALATIFGVAAGDSPRLYFADLAGAGIGAVAVIPLLNAFGGVDAVLLIAAVFGVAGMIMHAAEIPMVPAAVAIVAILALGSNLRLSWLAPNMATLATEKPISNSLSGGDLLQSEWDSFARTDLVAPGDGSPYRLYIDGGAGSVMPPAENNQSLRRDIGFLPFVTARPERVFIVGPGGGLDVWFGVEAGAERILGVEVNPASVAFVETYSDYTGGLYSRPDVRVVIDEGRSVLRREDARYDLIFLSQVVTLAAERSGYALTENTVYTVEAFEEYLAHLRPDGQIALKLYDEATLTRALSTALAALRRQGLSDAEALRHTAAFLDPRPNEPVPLLIVRKTPFTSEGARTLGATAQQAGFAPLYLPELVANPPLDEVQAGTTTFGDIAARSETNIAPPTDDRPFFFQFERGIPASLRPLLFTLVGVVVVGGGALAYAQRRIGSRALRGAPLYFAALGAGFIIVEIGIIQQTRLFLGHPTPAVTTVLAALLIGGGIGSILSGRLVSDDATVPVWPAVGVAALLILWLVTWPALSDQFVQAGQVARMLVAGASLLPLALFMGMPFPLGLRTVGRAGERHVALAWAVNGVMSVVGSAGAVTLAIVAGFSRVLGAGVFTYALAALLVYILWHR